MVEEAEIADDDIESKIDYIIIVIDDDEVVVPE